MCVWLILNTHIFLIGLLMNFFLSLINKLKLIGDIGSWGGSTFEAFVLFSMQTYFFLSFSLQAFTA